MLATALMAVAVGGAMNTYSFLRSREAGATQDDTYNKAEIGDDNSVTAKVTLSAGTQVGDLLVVKDGAGTALFSGQVTAEML